MRAYVADTNGGSEHGRVLVYDLKKGQQIRALDALYNPEVAVSDDGARLAVVDTDLGRKPSRHRICVYNVANWEVSQQSEFKDRYLYNVAPHSPELVFGHGGECYVLQSKIVGADEAEFAVGVLPAKGGKFEPGKVKLPYAVTHFGKVAGKDHLHFTLASRYGETVGMDSPAETKKHKNLIAMRTPSERMGKVVRGIFADDKNRWHTNQTEAEHDIAYSVGASAASSTEPVTYHVSPHGTLRIYDGLTNRISQPVELELPAGMRVPLQHAFMHGSTLFVGAASEELASRGQSQICMLYSVGAAGVHRERSLGLYPAAEKMYISPDGTTLVCLSREERNITLWDLESGHMSSRIGDVGVSPVSLALTA